MTPPKSLEVRAAAQRALDLEQKFARCRMGKNGFAQLEAARRDQYGLPRRPCRGTFVR
jgi:hypothetical protein